MQKLIQNPSNDKYHQEKQLLWGNHLLINFLSQDAYDRQGKFFVISGPSGVGKNTLLSYALKKVQGIYYLPSLTTRPIRPMEKPGDPYHFVSVEEFEQMIDADVFLEWQKIHNGNYYGTHLPTIEFAVDNGFDIATDMDVLGCSDAMEKFPNSIVSIFIAPPNLKELQNRLSKRDSNPVLANKRLARVEMEMSYLPKYQHVVLNDDLQRAGEELVDIFLSYRRPS